MKENAHKEKFIKNLPSYLYQNEIEEVITRNILGNHEIDHFSVNLMMPKKMIVFSSNLSLATDFQSTGYEAHFKAYSPVLYESYPIYAWDDCYEGVFGKKIQHMIHYKHGLNSGTMIIRKMPKFSIMYSVATRNKNPGMRTKIWNLADYILRAGDFAYNELRPFISEYHNHKENFPYIDKFCSISDLQGIFSEKTDADACYLAKYNPYKLTDKEIKCITLIRLGKNKKEISELLNRSIETVKTHLKNAKRKMGCRSLPEVVAEAINSGFVK